MACVPYVRFLSRRRLLSLKSGRRQTSSEEAKTSAMCSMPGCASAQKHAPRFRGCRGPSRSSFLWRIAATRETAVRVRRGRGLTSSPPESGLETRRALSCRLESSATRRESPLVPTRPGLFHGTKNGTKSLGQFLRN